MAELKALHHWFKDELKSVKRELNKVEEVLMSRPLEAFNCKEDMKTFQDLANSDESNVLFPILYIGGTYRDAKPSPTGPGIEFNFLIKTDDYQQIPIDEVQRLKHPNGYNPGAVSHLCYKMRRELICLNDRPFYTRRWKLTTAQEFSRELRDIKSCLDDIEAKSQANPTTTDEEQSTEEQACNKSNEGEACNETKEGKANQEKEEVEAVIDNEKVDASNKKESEENGKASKKNKEVEANHENKEGEAGNDKIEEEHSMEMSNSCSLKRKILCDEEEQTEEFSNKKAKSSSSPKTVLVENVPKKFHSFSMLGNWLGKTNIKLIEVRRLFLVQ